MSFECFCRLNYKILFQVGQNETHTLSPCPLSRYRLTNPQAASRCGLSPSFAPQRVREVLAELLYRQNNTNLGSRLQIHFDIATHRLHFVLQNRMKGV